MKYQLYTKREIEDQQAAATVAGFVLGYVVGVIICFAAAMLAVACRPR